LEELKKTIMVCFQVLYQYFFGGTEENDHGVLSGTIPVFFLEELKKTRKRNKVAGLQFRIRTVDLLNRRTKPLLSVLSH
jgi:hypothetical protein